MIINASDTFFSLPDFQFYFNACTYISCRFFHFPKPHVVVVVYFQKYLTQSRRNFSPPCLFVRESAHFHSWHGQSGYTCFTRDNSDPSPSRRPLGDEVNCSFSHLVNRAPDAASTCKGNRPSIWPHVRPETTLFTSICNINLLRWNDVHVEESFVPKIAIFPQF